MEYFHLGIFVTPRVYLIRKYGSQSQAFFSVVHRFFDTVWETSFKKAQDIFFNETCQNSEHYSAQQP